MKRLTLALLALSVLLIAPRPHNFTDRPRQDDRPMALGDYRKDTLSCAEDFCQDFEYTGGCASEHGWPWAEYVGAYKSDCNWDGDGVTSGTNAAHFSDAFDYVRAWYVIDPGDILYSQFSIRIISGSNSNFTEVFHATSITRTIYPMLMVKGTTTEFQLWCDIVGQSKSSSYTYTEDVDYIVRMKTDTGHPVTEQLEIFNTSMTLLDTLTCASDGLEFFDPHGFDAGNVGPSKIGSLVIDDIQLSLDAF